MSSHSCTRWSLAAVALLIGAAIHAAEEPPTVIESNTGEMVSSETESTFTFRENVVVTGTNIKITCDQLVVIANRTGDVKATLGKQDKFKSLVATGHVRILQNDREAVCDRAEVFPGEDKVVLTGHPSVRSLDGQYRADGPRLVLYRGERRAVIEGGPTERTHITLPPLKDLGYGKEGEKNAPSTPNPGSPPPTPKQ
jgi:lipopolysaccharide export system protein LptA